MKKYSFVTGCFLLLFFFTACKKELSENITIYTNHPLNDTIWVRFTPGAAAVHTLPGLFVPEIVLDSFDCVQGDTLQFGDSLSVQFPAGACTNPGTSTPPSGKVRLEIFRLRTKGDFIKFFKPTTSNGYLLESAGGFFVRVSKDGKELALAPGATITIRYSDTEEPKNNMQVFHARETIPFITKGFDTLHNWTRNTDTSWVKTWQRLDTAGAIIKRGYELTSDKLRWLGAHRFIDSTLPKTRIFALLSPNFTNKNTMVFAVFANQKTVVGLSPDYASRTFMAANIPLRSKIRLVSVSRIGTDLYLGVKEINDVGTVVHYKIEPQKRSLKYILEFLNGL